MLIWIWKKIGVQRSFVLWERGTMCWNNFWWWCLIIAMHFHNVYFHHTLLRTTRISQRKNFKTLLIRVSQLVYKKYHVLKNVKWMCGCPTALKKYFKHAISRDLSAPNCTKIVTPTCLLSCVLACAHARALTVYIKQICLSWK